MSVPGRGAPGTRLRLALIVVAVTLIAAPTSGATAAAHHRLTAATQEEPLYTGPYTVPWGGELKASVDGADVAAVTFALDGRSYLSDTTRPFAVPLLPHTIPLGRHSLRVVVVRRDGSRAASPTATLRVVRGTGRELVAAPGRRFAAALRALSNGHVTVRLRPGIYRDVTMRLGSGSVLLGGSGVVLMPPDGDYTSVVFVAGDNVAVSGLTIDGRGQGGGAGHGIEIGPSHHVLVRQVRVVHTRTDAVNIWGTVEDATVQDSSFDGAGGAAAGVVAGISDTADLSVLRTRISRFREFGINFAQVRFDLMSRGLRNVALDNTITDIRAPIDTQGRTQGGIWSGGAQATLVGNRIMRTGWDGIETVGTSTGVTIARNDVRATRTGIYLEHATNHSSVSRNSISDVRVGINVEWRYGGVGSGSNWFVGNRIAASSTGIFINTGSDGNLVKQNVLAAQTATPIVLQGSSYNTLVGNVACGRSNPGIQQQTGLADNGQPIRPQENRLTGNRGTGRCR